MKLLSLPSIPLTKSSIWIFSASNKVFLDYSPCYTASALALSLNVASIADIKKLLFLLNPSGDLILFSPVSEISIIFPKFVDLISPNFSFSLLTTFSVSSCVISPAYNYWALAMVLYRRWFSIRTSRSVPKLGVCLKSLHLVLAIAY